MTKKTVLLKHLIYQADLVTVDNIEVENFHLDDSRTDGEWVRLELANEEAYYVHCSGNVEITGDVHPVEVDAVDYRHFDQEPEANWQTFQVTLRFFRREERPFNVNDCVEF